MDLNKTTRIIILTSISLIAISIGYYFLIFLPQKRTAEIKKECIDRVLKQLETETLDEVRDLILFSGRGCFIKAGGMGDVKDANFKPLFNEYNAEYDRQCQNGVLDERKKIIETEKTKRITECIKLYLN